MPSDSASAIGESRSLRLYGVVPCVLWAAVFCLALLLQLLPNSGVAPMVFYAIAGAKLAVIFLLGLLAPLAFWRFDSLGLGAVLALLSTAIAEGAQSLSRGHRSSWLEFGLKVLLIFVGFAWGLNARYENRLRLPFLSIPLHAGGHAPEPPSNA